jgi:Txe/YoeB family toxin of Txe-Axe toxin-antitoxin module
MLPVQIVRNGSPEPPAPATELRAGPLTLEFQDGDLRYIKLGAQEILRRIYVAVRDHNWDTVAAVRSNLHIKTQADRFLITYDAEHLQGEVHFAWSARITGASDGRICFRMQGRALSTFRRCRIGFCILHPMDCAGA